MFPIHPIDALMNVNWIIERVGYRGSRTFELNWFRRWLDCFAPNCIQVEIKYNCVIL